MLPPINSEEFSTTFPMIFTVARRLLWLECEGDGWYEAFSNGAVGSVQNSFYEIF